MRSASLVKKGLFKSSNESGRRAAVGVVRRFLILWSAMWSWLWRALPARAPLAVPLFSSQNRGTARCTGVAVRPRRLARSWCFICQSCRGVAQWVDWNAFPQGLIVLQISNLYLLVHFSGK